MNYILKIIGYETGLRKIEMTNLLTEALELDEKESGKMTDAVMSGNVISLKFQDEEFTNKLAEDLEVTGARIQIEHQED